MVDISRANTLRGWSHEKELVWLAEQAARRTGNIVEIGSWMGRTARAMADNTPATVYAVDTWNGTPEDGHFKLLKDKPEDWLYEQFLAGVNDHVACGQIVPVRAASVDAAKYFAGHNRTFSMVFIDAAHDYTNVKTDILTWRPMLEPGGLLCGHDYDDGRSGVIRAVKECVRNFKRGAGSIWFEVQP